MFHKTFKISVKLGQCNQIHFKLSETPIYLHNFIYIMKWTSFTHGLHCPYGKQLFIWFTAEEIHETSHHFIVIQHLLSITGDNTLWEVTQIKEMVNRIILQHPGLLLIVRNTIMTKLKMKDPCTPNCRSSQTSKTTAIIVIRCSWCEHVSASREFGWYLQSTLQTSFVSDWTNIRRVWGDLQAYQVYFKYILTSKVVNTDSS